MNDTGTELPEHIKPLKIAYIVTHPITARYFLKGQLAYMKNMGMNVCLITSPGKDLDGIAEREGVSVFAIPMQREIHLLQDIRSLIRLYFLIRRLKPDIVNASTPKGGLLGMIASWASRVPMRVYTLRGLRLETTSGLTRSILSWTEKISSACAHRVICVSESLRQTSVSLGLINERKSRVIGAGSSNGVDVEHFSHYSAQHSEEIRKKLGLPSPAHVIGFVGRISQDKGIAELLEAFEIVSTSITNCYLLIVGGFEEGDPIPIDLVEKIRNHPNIRLTSFVQDPAGYYGVMDVLAFPSYREGFPNVPLEAGACGIPTIGFRVTGTKDVIADGVTGKLVAREGRSLAEAIAAYFQNERLRIEHGNAAKERVNRLFRREHVWAGLYQEYTAMMKQFSHPNH